jgi:hypothetical protein
MRKQLDEWQTRAGDREAIRDAARPLDERFKLIEGELINLDFEKPRPGPNRIKEKLDALSSMIDESDDAPTQGAYEVYDLLRGQVETQLARLRELLDGPVQSFNELVRSEQLPAVAP